MTSQPGANVPAPASLPLIPRPAVVEAGDGEAFVLTSSTQISVPDGADFVALSTLLESIVGGTLGVERGMAGPVDTAATHSSVAGVPAIVAELTDAGADANLEAYRLEISAAGVRLVSPGRAGLFHAASTLAQIVAACWAGDVLDPAPAGQILLPALTIQDTPRYSWRGLSLDVARSFFPVEEVKAVIDLLVSYKLNVLHLHLNDDQGWRIEIDGWPLLTEVSGNTSMVGGRSGFYTQAQFTELVEYAAAREVLIVPEIDVPGHTHSVQVAYPDLQPDPVKRGETVAPYGGMEVGFSAITLDTPGIPKFLDDVFGQLIALTPGGFIHIGGDEANAMTMPEYCAVIEYAQGIVNRHGKRAIGWNETVMAALTPSTMAEFWDTNADPTRFVDAARNGHDVILAPATRTYLDMKHVQSQALGQDWAGLVDLHDSYDWEPETLFPGMPPERIVGVEAGMWTETVFDFASLGELLLPRLPAVADVAWTASGSDWERFRGDIVRHALPWTQSGWVFYPSTQVEWLHA